VVKTEPPANPLQSDFRGKVNPSSRLLLRASIGVVDADGSAGTANLSQSVWHVSPLPDPSRECQPLCVTQKGSSFIVAENALEEGLQYTFRLEHTHGGVMGYSEVKLDVNSAPTAGIFSIKPKTGADQYTQVNLMALGWVDAAEDQPFMYEYRVQSFAPGSLGTRALLARKASNVHGTILPEGRNMVYCYIQDKYGAQAMRNLTVEIGAGKIDMSDGAR
jgi:hypothetical protein